MVRLGGLCSFFKILCYASNAMLVYSIFMLVEYTIMLNTVLTVVVVKITKKVQHLFLADVVYQWPLLIWALTVTLSLAVTLS